MIDLYHWPTPNGHKAAIALEEMGLPYTLHPTDILKGDQLTPEFRAMNPNHRIPTIVDRDGPSGEPYVVWESGAILMYLAEKSGQFWPADPATRWRHIQWLTFQVASMGPMFGQCGHFLGYAPEPIPYAINRYQGETKRLYALIDAELATRDYLAGDYGIADMAAYPWVMPKVRELHHIELDTYPNVKRWHDAIAARPAVQRGTAILSDKIKYGNPDEEGRKSLFGAIEEQQNG